MSASNLTTTLVQAAGGTIALDGCTKLFDEQAVVEDVSFGLGRGQIMGLIGPSGCGKTTTVRMVMGVLAPDRGQVLVLGRDPHRFTARFRERLGYMPQHFVLYPELTVRENIDFVASLYGVPFRGRGKRIDRMLDFVELGPARNRLAGQVSGGMQRRIELACTLIHDPEVIVFDEPTAGIDPVLRQKFWNHFRELREQGRTLLVTTQYVTEAEYCDVVGAMHAGRMVALDSPDGLRHSAIGGEVVDVQAEGLTRGCVAQIEQIEGVRRVERVSPEELRVTVADAGAAIPQIMEVLQEAGLSVDDMSEYRPNFDEVFVRLMAVHDAESAAAIEASDRAADRIAA